MTRLTYASLPRAAQADVVRYTFTQGHGGPLVFLWTVGLGLFLVVWSLPIYAVVWTAACLAIAGVMIRDDRANPRVVARISRALMQGRYPPERLRQPHLRDAVTSSIGVYLEALRKLGEMQATRPLDDNLAGTAADMERLLALQYESALQVEELERLLDLVSGPARSVGGDSLRQRNVEAITREAAEAAALVEEIGQRLETAMLQVFRMDRQPLDVLAVAETTHHAAAALDQLQSVVDARRAAASELIALVTHSGPAPATSAEIERPTLVWTNPPAAATVAPTAAVEPLSQGEGSSAELVPLLEEALRRLHTPSALATSALTMRLPHTLAEARGAESAGVPGAATSLEQAQALRDTLVAAIERLRLTSSGDRAPGRTAEVLQHDLLAEQYVQGLSTKQIFLRHNISESTLHRYRREAVRLLAHELHQHEALLTQAGRRSNGTTGGASQQPPSGR